MADFLVVARQAAEALQAAHAAQPRPVYHRDVKPDNMLVGERLRIKMIDYGLAVRIQSAHKSVAKPAECRSKQDQSYAGTLEFSPPEQKGELSIRSAPIPISTLSAAPAASSSLACRRQSPPQQSP